MSEQATLLRKWVPMAGGSCDVRMGPDALEQSSKVFRSSVGRPRACVVVLRADTDAELAERLRRQLVDAGFDVRWHEIAERDACTLAVANRLCEAFATERLTADDLCCVVGDADVASVASHVCGSWCGGMSLVAVPTSELALLEGALVPRALDVGDARAMVAVRPCARHVLLDYDLAISPLDSEQSRRVRALMASAAMCGSEREFSALWDRADALMGDDSGAFIDQLLATAKARGQITGSTAVAIRQSIGYGETFARAVDQLCGHTLPLSALLGEGMRFAARLSVAQGKLSLDDMLAQDELLETLGIGSVSCGIAPDELVGELRHERFARSNRFMLPVPLAIGRVRLATVEDDLLQEHATAWCATHH